MENNKVSITITGVPNEDGLLMLSWKVENFESLWSAYQMLKMSYAITSALTEATERQIRLLPMRLKPTDTNEQLKKKFGEKLLDMDYFRQAVFNALQTVGGANLEWNEDDQKEAMKTMRKAFEEMGQKFDSDEEFEKFFKIVP